MIETCIIKYSVEFFPQNDITLESKDNK